MPKLDSHAVTNKTIFLGNNEVQVDMVSVEAGRKLGIGAVLYRIISSGDLGRVTNISWQEIDVTDEQTGAVNKTINNTPIHFPAGILLENLDNSEGADPKVFKADVLISGKVRADMTFFALDAGPALLTPYAKDLLRRTGIIPINVTDISRQDN
jgi:hypothetical protein